MKEFTTTVDFEEGLHARPATLLVKLCQMSKSDIKIIKGTTSVNPKSILGILTLAAAHKDVLTITVEGEDEDVYAEKIKEFFDQV